MLLMATAAILHETNSFSIARPTTLSCPAMCTPSIPSQLFESSDDENYEPPKEKKGFFANFFEELDAFVDDATSRRLGNGAQYYGKRKSSFYGKDDANKKRDKVSFVRVVGCGGNRSFLFDHHTQITTSFVMRSFCSMRG